MAFTTEKPMPRDLVDPAAGFGRSPAVRWRDDVDAVLCERARAQHEAALAVHLRGDRSAAARVATRFGFSVKTWSDHCLGKRWATAPTWAGLAVLLIEQEQASATRSSAAS